MNEELPNLDPKDLLPMQDAYKTIRYNGNLAADVLGRLPKHSSTEQTTSTQSRFVPRWFMPLAIAAGVTLVIGAGIWQGWFVSSVPKEEIVIKPKDTVLPVIPDKLDQPTNVIEVAQNDTTEDEEDLSTPSWPTETPGLVPSLNDVSAPSISFTVSSVPCFPTMEEAMAEESDNSTTTSKTKQRSS